MSNASQAVYDPDCRDVYAFLGEGVPREAAEEIIAHSADQVGRRTRAYRRSRLVSAFATQPQGEVGADDRLTGPRQWRAEGRQVGIDAAYHRHTGAVIHVARAPPFCVLLAHRAVNPPRRRRSQTIEHLCSL